MKNFLLLLLNVMLFSCQQTTHAPATLPKADTTQVADNEEAENNGHLQKDMIIPEGIKTDTLKNFDSTLAFDVSVIYAYPTDASQTTYRELLHKAIDPELKKFQLSVAKAIKEEGGPESALQAAIPNYFDASPCNYYQDDKIVSIRYILSNMTAGAVHPVSWIVSVNYDKQNKKPITLHDYFKFESKRDTDLIINLLDEEFEDLRDHAPLDSPWQFYGMDHLDFHIRKDAVYFNFADYQLGQGPSMMEYAIKKSKLANLIQPEYLAGK